MAEDSNNQNKNEIDNCNVPINFMAAENNNLQENLNEQLPDYFLELLQKIPNELEADKENLNLDFERILETDDVAGFKEDAEQRINVVNEPITALTPRVEEATTGEHFVSLKDVLHKFTADCDCKTELSTKLKNKPQIISVVNLNVPLENISKEAKQQQEETLREQQIVEKTEAHDAQQDSQQDKKLEDKAKNFKRKRLHVRVMNLNIKKHAIYQQKINGYNVKMHEKSDEHIQIVKSVEKVNLAECQPIIEKIHREAVENLEVNHADQADEINKSFEARNLCEESIEHASLVLNAKRNPINHFKIKKCCVRVQRLDINKFLQRRQTKQQQKQLSTC